MKLTTLRQLSLVGAFCAAALTASAQIIELRATINGAQENPAVTTPASGTAVMLYDINANTFDLIVSIRGMTNTITLSHIHEAAAGANGPVVTNIGPEAVYTRTGDTLTATFRNISHAGGDPLRLLQGGAYYNIHSAQFPGGEIRGQLIARPVRLIANIDVAQEQAAMPAANLAGITTFGGAVVIYDPVANTVALRHTLFNYTSTLTNAHIHIGAPGVSGGVITQLFQGALASNFSATTGFITASHEPAPFVPADNQQLARIRALLSGGCYLNYHSQAFPNGQARGQLTVSSEALNTRMGNLSVRSFVGAGDQVLIGGISIQGNEPVRVLIAAKGPSLTAFGVAGALANPRLALFSGANQIAANDDVGTPTVGTELARIPNVPTNPLESALVVTLPPGNYTAQVSSAAGTGVAILEAYDLRNLPSTLAIASTDPVVPASASTRSVAAASGKPVAPELCVATPLPVTAVATR
ncbi:MAG: CHRD domain-containing protein [Opitutaceae bacterium]|nr:CHRD domain-containing protein [Opitutaceae bacterium]